MFSFSAKFDAVKFYEIVNDDFQKSLIDIFNMDRIENIETIIQICLCVL